MTGQVIQLRRRVGREPEAWVTRQQFCEEIALLIGGHKPNIRWIDERIKEGMPSGKYVGRRLVPRDRGLKWLRDQGRIP